LGPDSALKKANMCILSCGND